jgi:predicted AlkP superfamily phosphohydrolase/phosphomutase
VLAVDAASPFLLREWAADGTLPNLGALMATGLVGETRSVDGLFDGATWPSFYTGLSPAGHGFYWLDQLRSGSYRMVAMQAASFSPLRPFWDTLSAAGRRVLVLDVPIAVRSSGLNGVQIVEWGCHDAIFGHQTTPRGLKRAIQSRVGDYPAPEPCDQAHRTLGEYQDFAARLVRGATAKGRLTRELLARQRWDFAIQVFSEAHCGGHQLWHLHDPSHPQFDPAVAAVAGDPVRLVYQALDTAIGEIVGSVGPETTVVLLDLHGMTCPSGFNFLVPELLIRFGVMVRASAQAGAAALAVSPAQPTSPGWRALYRRLPAGIRRPLYDARQALNRRLGRGTLIDLDPARSKCFDLPIGAAFAAIRLNLRGREPLGTLNPGAEAERFCEQLTQDFQQLTQADTGRPLVRRVLRSAELFRGPHQGELPDLLIEWNPEQRVGSALVGNGAAGMLRVHSPRVGLLEGANPNCRTGEHRPEGMFIARGPGIAPGRLERVTSNLDLAPTFARFLGCEMPGVDGQPIPELLSS